MKKAIKVYEYPKCSTCKNALKYLDAQDLAYQRIDISEQPPSKAELKAMLKRYGGDLRKLFNTSGLQYREMKLGEKIGKMNEKDALELLAKNGKLVKRPFLISGGAGCVGFKKEQWEEIVG